MMVFLKYLLIVLLFFITSLLQFSFLPYFSIAGLSLNLVFLLFFLLLHFFECPATGEAKSHNNYAIFFLIILAGFFLDAYSPYSFGMSTVALFFVYGVKKLILHFIQDFKETNLIYFLGIFLLCFAVYNLVFRILLMYFYGFSMSFVGFKSEILPTAISTLYNFIVILLMFYGYKKIRSFMYKDRQLKLL